MVKLSRLPVLFVALVGASLLAPASAGAVAPAVGVAFGTVTAVDGVTTAGTCGTSGAAGTVTVATRTGDRTVLVTTTTTFIDPRVVTASYASVCVGRMIGAGGPVASGVVTARFLVVAPPLPVVAVGLVTAVNGVTTAGTCGTAGTAGSFAVTTRSGAATVNVSAGTAFVGVPSASFAKVCVNGVVAAVGSGSPIDAFRVIVTSAAAPGRVPTARALGVVTAVNGVSTPGTCGTAGAAGTFVLATRTGSRTVSVAADTAFIDPRIATDTFGSVCVGRTVGALGSPGSVPSCLALSCPTAPIDARLVVVVGTIPSVVVGVVTSVNGVSTPGTCGTAGGTGSIGLVTRTGVATLNVTATTQFRGVMAPSFSKVCVGGVVAAVGTGGATLDALRVVLTRRVV